MVQSWMSLEYKVPQKSAPLFSFRRNTCSRADDGMQKESNWNPNEMLYLNGPPQRVLQEKMLLVAYEEELN